MKISGLVEVMNHIACVDYLLKEPMEQITVKYIKDLHKMLVAGAVDEQLDRVVSGVYRRPDINARKRDLPLAMEVPDRMKQLIKEYEKKEAVGLLDLLEFHEQIERLI